MNNIRTIVVLASVDAVGQQTVNQLNKKARRSLLSIIKSRGYACVPAMENYGNFERPYAIFNMSLDMAKKMCGKYQQTSFVFSVLNEDGMIHNEYYTKQNSTHPYSKKANNHIIIEECDTWEDTSNADGNFMVIGKEFYGVPMFLHDDLEGNFPELYSRIPDDTDVLLTHQAPLGILDERDGINFGDYYLYKRVIDVRPKYHLFGHIHHTEKTRMTFRGVRFSNAAGGKHGRYELCFFFKTLQKMKKVVYLCNGLSNHRGT